jgi:hypothetical protein
MLTGLAGLASLLLLIERRPAWAGVASGLSVLVSQKGAYYVVAGLAAVSVYWAVSRRQRSAFFDTIRFGGASAATLLVYIAFWSVIASPSSVFRTTFIGAANVALSAVYDIRLWGWQLTLKPNPIYYALAVPAFLALAQRWHERGRQYHDVILLTYGLVVVGLSVWHKQPWPYFFVLVIPTLFVLHVALFDAELARHERAGTRPSPIFVGLLIAFGLYVPLRRVPKSLARDNGFQRNNVRLVDKLVRPGETYLAGVSLLHDDRAQPVRELTWLDQRYAVQLASYDAQRLQNLIVALQRSPMKLFVHNYRIEAMPAPIREHLAREYAHLWGNTFIYAPVVGDSARTFDLKFSGRYVIRGALGAMEVDGRPVAAGDTLVLGRGRHTASTEYAFRLVLAPPELREYADPRYEAVRDFFPDVYTY